jgi:hypothetical protein
VRVGLVESWDLGTWAGRPWIRDLRELVEREEGDVLRKYVDTGGQEGRRRVERKGSCLGESNPMVQDRRQRFRTHPSASPEIVVGRPIEEVAPLLVDGYCEGCRRHAGGGC